MMTHHTQIDSPIGKLLLIADDRALLEIRFELDRRARLRPADGPEEPNHPILRLAARQLAEYFAGCRQSFDLPLAPVGTPFQQRVWKALQSIPFGQTCSYGDIARKIHHPKAVRAVGLANGANPIPVIVPCHRVIGANGNLTGYGGGLDRKRILLDLESGDKAKVGKPLARAS